MKGTEVWTMQTWQARWNVSHEHEVHYTRPCGKEPIYNMWTGVKRQKLQAVMIKKGQIRSQNGQISYFQIRLLPIGEKSGAPSLFPHS